MSGWHVTYPAGRLNLHVADRIQPEDAARQERTAAEILRRLETQPGVVLADEVGMGKTFVALAVAVSTAWADTARRPVIVMVPSSIPEKWARDAAVFLERCVKDPRDRTLRVATARSGLEFFRLLDDEKKQRARLIFVTHGALHRGLEDPWVKLAILKVALSAGRFNAQREVFPRFAARILRKNGREPDEKLAERLMSRNPTLWRKVLRADGKDPGDDPVPADLFRVIEQRAVDLEPLREALEGLPIRESVNIEERLEEVRTSLRKVLPGVWQAALCEARISSPLLILDEAHHLKDPATRLASLFVEPDAEDSARLLDGALSHSFERMLFLTATPFQLGHHELLNVLDRFRGVKWGRDEAKPQSERFGQRMKALAKALDDAAQATAHLDRAWQRLSFADLRPFVREEDGDSSDAWWERARAEGAEWTPRLEAAMRAYDRAQAAMAAAGTELRPWVIRHLRPRILPDQRTPRRVVLPGAAIEAEDKPRNLRAGRGLSVDETSLLPFLLAARCQTLVSRRRLDGTDGAARATFAEGLASSYEAFLDTRAAKRAGRPLGSVLDEESWADALAESDGGRVRWYVDRLQEALPEPAAFASHPKIRATAQKAVALWRRGEKVLIFCHYRKTGRALVRHISRLLEREFVRAVTSAEDVSARKVPEYFERSSRRFDLDRPLGRALRAVVDEMLDGHSRLPLAERDQIHEVARRFVRGPSFLVRFYPPGTAEKPDDFLRAVHAVDASGQSLHAKLRAFLHFVAVRCTEEERRAYLAALESISTRAIWTVDDAVDEETTGGLFAPVRLAAGGVKREDRQQLMLGFNTPFFPEILVASSVLAEGVDLHLNCRYVIHHDLCWNPSTLEQRTGRIDRIGAKAEQALQPIHTFEPFVTATQDEKMYRVVKDRERWFQVLLSERFVPDEAQTDGLEGRAALPELAAGGLAFGLSTAAEQHSICPGTSARD